MTGCDHFSCDSTQEKITDITVLEMVLIKDRAVPLAFLNQDGKDITHLVTIAAADPAQANIYKNIVSAKITGEIELIVSGHKYEETFFLSSMDSSKPLIGIPIGILQSPTFLSPYDGIEVKAIQGIITGKGYNKFYIQSVNPDDFRSTSEGILVYEKPLSNYKVGDIISVDGELQEFGDIKTNSVTQIKATKIYDSCLLSAFPDPIDLSSLIPPNRVISSYNNLLDPTHILKPETEGIDFWESIESMSVKIPSASVVAPYGYGDFFIVSNAGQNTISMNDRGALVLEENNANPEKIAINVVYDKYNKKGDEWGVSIGDSFSVPIIGNIGQYDSYFKCPMLDAQYSDKEEWWASKKEKNNPREESKLWAENQDTQLSIASFNVENFYKSSSQNNKRDDIAKTIVDALNCPDIIALAEITDNNGKTNNGVTAADETAAFLIEKVLETSGIEYTYTDIEPINNADGGLPGANIRVGYLYNAERVQLADSYHGKGTSTANISIMCNNGDIKLCHNPVRIVTDAFDESRKPLVAHFLFNNKSVFLINCHLKSKRGDESQWGMNQPPILHSENIRTPQCEDVNDVVLDMLKIDNDANIIVLGDLNDFSWSNPIKALRNNVLKSLVDEKLPSNERYSYVFSGNSQQLDHILVTKNLVEDAKVDIVHRYCEYLEQYTDHDPIIAIVTPK